MKAVWEQPIKSRKKGAFITHSAYIEICPGRESVGPVGTQGIFGFSCTDNCLHFYMKTKSAFRYWRGIETPVIMTKIWYLQDLNLWATGGQDNKLYLWRIA